MSRSILVGSTAVLVVLSFVMGVFAGSAGDPAPVPSVPMLIPYQGALEIDGVAVSAIGAQKVDFRVALFDDPALTTDHRVWPDEGTYGLDDAWDFHSVNVYGGRFAFNIGEDKTYVHVEDTPLYLEIQVRGPGAAPADPYIQLSGRKRFLSTPFAVAAERADMDFLVPGALTASTAQLGDTTVADLTVSGNLKVDGGILENVSMFGAWTTCNHSTQYTAATDLFVVAWGQRNTAQGHYGLSLKTPANSGTARINSASRVEAGVQITQIVVPVRKGDTWQISVYGTGDAFNCWTLPLGR